MDKFISFLVAFVFLFGLMVNVLAGPPPGPPPHAVPEPSTLLLLGSGLAALIGLGILRKKLKI